MEKGNCEYKKKEMKCEPLDCYFESKMKVTLSIVFGTYLGIAIIVFPFS